MIITIGTATLSGNELRKMRWYTYRKLLAKYREQIWAEAGSETSHINGVSPPGEVSTRSTAVPGATTWSPQWANSSWPGRSARSRYAQ